MRAKEVIELISHEQIKDIMTHLGSSVCIENHTKNCYMFSTICHGGNSHKLYYFLDSKYFHCFTNCGQLSIFNIVEQVRNCSFREAKQYVINYFKLENEFGFEEDDIHRINDWDIFNKFDNSTIEAKEIEELKVYDDKVMTMFSKAYYQGWIDDGISIQTMKRYDIMAYPEQKAIIIPHHNECGDLIGIRKRSLDEEDVARGNKYMPICIEGRWYTHPLQFNLYGLNHNKENIIRYKKIVLVESEKGVMQLDTMYPTTNCSVALSSSNLSNAQVEMILALGVEEVVFALDKQYQEPHTDEYRTYQKKIVKLASKLTAYVNVTIMWDLDGLIGYKDSPTDKGKEIFETLMKNRRNIKTKS